MKPINLPFFAPKVAIAIILIFSVFPAPAQTQTYHWNQAKLGAGGWVTGIEIHPTQPSLKVIRTDVGGVYIWNSTNSAWTPITDTLIASNLSGHYEEIESIAIDSTDSSAQTLYIAAGRDNATGLGDVFKSTDRGSHWTATHLNVPMFGNGDYRWFGERLAVDPHNGQMLYFGSRSSGLWKTTNGGGVWKQVSGFPNSGAAGNGIAFVAFDRGSRTANSATQTLYVGVIGDGGVKPNGVYKSVDGGTSWQLLSGPGTNYTPTKAAIASDGSLYVSYIVCRDPENASVTGGAIYKFSNTRDQSGAVAANISPASGQGFSAVAVDPTKPNTLVASKWYYGSYCNLYRSTDGGRSWIQRNVDDITWQKLPGWYNYTKGTYQFLTGPAAMAIDPANPSSVWLADGFAVWRTDNAADFSTWSYMSDGLEEVIANVFCKPPGESLLSGTCDRDGFRHVSLTTAPDNTFQNGLFGDTTGFDFCENHPSFVVRVCARQYNKVGDSFPNGFYSTNGGATWTLFGTRLQEHEGGRIAVASQNTKNIVWTPSGWDSGAFYTKDGGNTWTKSSGPVDSAGNSAVSYIADTWSQRQPLAADRVQDGVFYFLRSNSYDGNPSTVNSFYRSTNGGANWSRVGTIPITNETDLYTIKAVPGNAGEVWVNYQADNVGLFRTVDGGQTFGKIQGVQRADAVAFGKGTGSAPAVFIIGTMNGVRGIFVSNDATASTYPDARDAHWQQLDVGSTPIITPRPDGFIADRETYGNLYSSGAGRGIFYGTFAASDTGSGSGTGTGSDTGSGSGGTTNPGSSSGGSTTPTLANLLSDPSFESGNMTAWSDWPTNAKVVSTNAHSGHSACQVTNQGMAQSKPVQPNTDYSLSGWGFSNDGQASMGYWLYDQGGHLVSGGYLPPFGTSYSYQSTVFHTTNNTSFIVVGVWGGGNGSTSYFDDFRLTKNLVKNGDFELGNTGWQHWGTHSSIASSGGHTGPAVGKITGGADGEGETISVKAGASYTLSGWGSNTSNVYGALGYQFFDKNWNPVGAQIYLSTFGSSYSNRQTTITTPSSAAYILVDLWGGSSTSTSLFDDIALIEN
ncbi:MAG: carbohydrate binding domain-containing protein [Verrucomicrobiota bacterium]